MAFAVPIFSEGFAHVNSRKMLESSVLVVSMSNGVVESLFGSSKLASSEVHFFKVLKED